MAGKQVNRKQTLFPSGDDLQAESSNNLKIKTGAAANSAKRIRREPGRPFTEGKVQAVWAELQETANKNQRWVFSLS